MTHTPGLWRVKPERDLDDITALSIVDANENEIAYLYAMYYDDDDSLYTNAHLIAAAPETKEQRDELLEACEDALDLVRTAYKVQEMDDLGPWPEEIITQLQAAIAKAKGGG